ncbi:GCN5 family acetyltransferase [Massilia sp. Leaf139]|nr:GCN5 family acetyltransferase [Massilia sp. Leaf139]
MHITLASPADTPHLFEVWEASVTATHDFLDAAAIAALAPIVQELLHSFTPIHCIRGEDGLPFAFMGVQEGMLEMLFVHPSRRGQGAGRLLATHALNQLGVTQVDVNEDNRQALGFYERLGFRTEGRSATDGFGKPYPILHMRLG